MAELIRARSGSRSTSRPGGTCGTSTGTPGWPGSTGRRSADRYATLLPRISTRQELADLLGELIGELATSHTYVWGGDAPDKVDWVSTGLLGADLVRAGDAYQVTRIYHGDRRTRSPARCWSRVTRSKRASTCSPSTTVRSARTGRCSPSSRARPACRSPRPSTTPTDPGRAHRVVVTRSPTTAILRYVDWVRKNRGVRRREVRRAVRLRPRAEHGHRGPGRVRDLVYLQPTRRGWSSTCGGTAAASCPSSWWRRLRRDVIGFDCSRGGGSRPIRTGC